eukprot:751335-Hanusia_phi.AAC.1
MVTSPFLSLPSIISSPPSPSSSVCLLPYSSPLLSSSPSFSLSLSSSLVSLALFFLPLLLFCFLRLLLLSLSLLSSRPPFPPHFRIYCPAQAIFSPPVLDLPLSLLVSHSQDAVVEWFLIGEADDAILSSGSTFGQTVRRADRTGGRRGRGKERIEEGRREAK